MHTCRSLARKWLGDSSKNPNKGSYSRFVSTSSSEPRPSSALYVLAAAYVVLLLAPNLFGEYGYFIDELYYVACTERLAFGYVDHPPLSIWLLWVSRTLLGDSQLALRVLPALAGAAAVVLTGRMAWRLGARGFGQVLAGLALAVAPIPTLFFGFYSMNAFELLAWTAASYALVEGARSRDGRWWLAFGAIAGLGLLNKHTFVLFGGALALGVALTPMRRELATGRLWLGVAIAAVLVLPNVAWQFANDWKSLEFYANADAQKSVPTPALEVFVQQVLFMNPAAALVWVAGAGSLLFGARGRPWRHLGWLFLALLVLIVASQKSRPDRIAGAYPVALAAGAVVWEAVAAARRMAWVRWALPALLVVAGAALAPLAYPVLPPAQLADYAQKTGIVPQIEAGEGKRGALPQWMADRFDWQEFVDQVAGIVDGELTADERARAVILVPSYGHAGALELLGRGLDLPPVAGTQNSYHDWAPIDAPVDVLVAVSYSESLGQLYGRVDEVARTSVTWGTPWRDDLPIVVAREPRATIWDYWDQLRHYE